MYRKKTREVKIGNRYIGGDNPILIQSMCNSPTYDVNATVEQILRLEALGCEIVRVSVPDEESAKAIKEIKKAINIPLVADIHFNYRLAIMSIDNGIDKIRINPGNIGSEKGIKELVTASKLNNIPIRIGVNSGSVNKQILAKYGKVCAEALRDSALEHTRILEKYDFYNTVISVKSSSVKMTYDTNILLSEITDYPLHLGVTECGANLQGEVKSAIGIGSLLMNGIGDTIRVSVTGDPTSEIPIAKEILSACGLRDFGVNIIACPTCARCQVDLKSIVDEVTELCSTIEENIDIAIMGCQVNGPGEAKNADIGIAGAPNDALLFKKGKLLSRHSYEDIKEALIMEIDKIIKERKEGKSE